MSRSMLVAVLLLTIVSLTSAVSVQWYSDTNCNVIEGSPQYSDYFATACPDFTLGGGFQITCAADVVTINTFGVSDPLCRGTIIATGTRQTYLPGCITLTDLSGASTYGSAVVDCTATGPPAASSSSSSTAAASVGSSSTAVESSTGVASSAASVSSSTGGAAASSSTSSPAAVSSSSTAGSNTFSSSGGSFGASSTGLHSGASSLTGSVSAILAAALLASMAMNL